MTTIKKHSLPGICSYRLEKNIDERGFFAEVLRKDWGDFLNTDWITQINLSKSYSGIVHAWHRHDKGQIDYLLVIDGTLKIVAYDDESSSPTQGHICEITVSSEQLELVRIPGNYWHGHKSVGSSDAVSIYMVTQLYDYENPDEERRVWNDPSIIDPRTKEPYDWFSIPHK